MRQIGTAPLMAAHQYGGQSSLSDCLAVHQVPPEFNGLAALAWFSLAGNPACQPAPPIRSDILPMTLAQLELDTALGEGASGDVFAAKFQGRDVAIKIFKAEASPDGHARDEIAVTCLVNHPNLIKVIGIIDHPHALVLERVWGAPLALKPNFESLLRCRWTAGQTFTVHFVLNVATCVAAALAYLHAHNICHGDVYAHNVLAAENGTSVLCDYGMLADHTSEVAKHAMQQASLIEQSLANVLSQTFALPLCTMIQLMGRMQGVYHHVASSHVLTKACHTCAFTFCCCI